MEDAILRIDSVSVSYKSNEVLRDFSLSMSRGAKIIVAGPNGCGKTTLLRTILGLVKPTNGTVSTSKDANIAYCKQGFGETNTPVSVYEVVEMGLYGKRSNDRSCVERAMRQTNVMHLADRSFKGLSGGEKQRVSLARCICQEANLLLLDEPSSFLDDRSREEFVSTMKNLPEGIAAIVVTHDEELSRKLGWPTIRVDKGMAAV